MYKITDSVLATKAPSYIGVGIHEVELSEIVLDVSKNNKTFFAFYYVNEQGQKLSKTEWEVNLPEDMNSLTPDKKRAFEAVIQQQMKRILKVAKLFVPEEELKIDKDFNTFKEFCQFVKDKIGDKHKGVKLRIKATYDKNGWVTTPSYTYDSIEWIERVDKVPAEKSRIQMIEGRDVTVRPKLGNESRSKNPLLDDSNTNSKVTDIPAEKKGDDLPF